jgi:hypothetical protein
MEFNVSITGTKTVDIELDGLDELASDALDSELGNDLGDVSIEDVTVDGGTTVQAEVTFLATLAVSLEASDIEDLVRDKAEDDLKDAGVDSFDISSIEEA